MLTDSLAVSPVQISAAAALIAPHVRSTPIVELTGSEIGIDATVVVKLEHLQNSGSFKVRGAVNFLLSEEISDVGVVAASGGNHGAAVAWSARRFAKPAHIFVPTIAAPAKVQRLLDYGAHVHQGGQVYAEAFEASQHFIVEHGGTAIHAYDDPAVIAGAATCSKELDEQAGPFDAIFVSCGGGGLSGGAASWFGARTELVVCETSGTATYAAARRLGHPADIAASGIATDSLGANRIGIYPWAALSAVDATSVTVTDDALIHAKEQLWDWLRVIVEPGAAAPLAALLSGQWRARTPNPRIGIVLSGANTNLA